MGKATWIWYPGDYEIWLGNKVNNRRTERGTFFPPFWKSDSHYVTVEFSTVVDLEQDEEVEICVEGLYNVKLDGAFLFGQPSRATIPAGTHSLNIKVHNQATPPAIFVDGPTIKTGPSWKVTPEDLEWIDASGKVSDKSATVYAVPGSWDFDKAEDRPSEYRLPVKPMQPVSCEAVQGGCLYDFGCETIGYAVLEGLRGTGEVDIYYGESREEALDREWCETLDKVTFREDPDGGSCTMESDKAFRYIFVETMGSITLSGVSSMYEYLPETLRGSFRCNDPLINKIWDVSGYTLQLTTREVFIDGIKRDRWAWSGDAYQSYLMNWYLFFDEACVRRTTWLLRGKDPVTSHINTIMDYSFYWFLGIYDYYMYTADKVFVSSVYPRMRTLMDWILGRTDGDGLVCGRPGDWVFIDWADGEMSKDGPLSFEQVLFAKSLETMALCAEIAGVPEDVDRFGRLASDVRGKLERFWDPDRKAFVHNIEDGRRSAQITRYANMFAIFYGYLSPERQKEVLDSVLLNDDIMGITTPYMRFYELEALCALGMQNTVLEEIKSYWGGMLKEGATSFWEKYNPAEKGREHLAMYAKPYRKSLCHAWGASPVYLLGKYFAGVRPTAPGYSEFEVKPVLGGLEWFDSTVPTPQGEIRVHMDGRSIRVEAPAGKGTLVYTDGGERREVEFTGNIKIEYS